MSVGGWPLNGIVDDIEIYTVAHGDTAIKNLYRGSAAAHFAFINGTANDISGNAYALASNTAVATQGRVGTPNDAISVTGSQSISYGDLGGFENRSDVGVCAWMKKNNQSDGVVVAKSTDFPTGSWLLSTKSTGQLQFSVPNSSSVQVELAAAPLVPYHDDKWHLVCGSYDASGAVWITATDTCIYKWTGGTSGTANACGAASTLDLDTQGQPWRIWGGDIYGTPGSATDIGVGDSEIWVVSGGALKYLVKSAANFITDPTFSAQSGGKLASKVAVEKNGTEWVVATDSTIWRASATSIPSRSASAGWSFHAADTSPFVR